MTTLIWYRNDLRIDDHEPLADAAARGPVIGLYCFDPQAYGDTHRYGFPKTGPFRARFIAQSVADLRASLRAMGSELVVRVGRPETVLPEVARAAGADAVVGHAEATSEEQRVERLVRAALSAEGRTLRLYWGATLVHRDDLPFGSLHDLPDVFSPFRRAVEADLCVRRPVDPPRTAGAPAAPVDPGEIPRPESFGLAPPPDDPRGVLPFRGGEGAALDRVHAYFWEADALRHYKQTRNGLLGPNYSSKLSPWLALGCISPRRIYQEVRAYEAERIANDSTYWLLFELLWRDFFRFTAIKQGSRIFQPGGMKGAPGTGSWNPELFERWRTGRTGVPFVDANMREIAATGFMSNRGRQNVASYLAHDLGLPWLAGAEWFESLLVDYDPCSNYGNWCYVAGVGNDPREGRRFNVLKQAGDYDAGGDYVCEWVPELAGARGRSVHAPWLWDQDQWRAAGIQRGRDYPGPATSPPRWGTARRGRR